MSHNTNRNNTSRNSKNLFSNFQNISTFTFGSCPSSLKRVSCVHVTIHLLEEE